MFEDFKTDKSQTEKTEYKYKEENKFSVEKEPEKKEAMFSIRKKREEDIEQRNEKNDISFSAQHEEGNANREKSVIFAISKGNVLKDKEEPNGSSDIGSSDADSMQSEANRISKKSIDNRAKEYAYTHSSSFKTRNELSGFSFEQKSTANNTFNSADMTTSVASTGANKIAEATSDDEDEMRKKQFFINGAVAAGKIAISGGADTGEAVASFAKSSLQQLRSGSTKSNASMTKGNGGAAVVVMVVLLIAVISTVLVISAIYPFYMTTNIVEGYVSQAGEFIEGMIDDIKNLFGYTKTEKKELVASDFKDTVKHYSEIMDGVVGEDNARIKAMFGGSDAEDSLDTFDELDAEMLAEEFGMSWDVEQYRKDCIEYENGGWKKGMECPTLTDYYDGGKGNKKWEGYEWSPDTQGTKIPKDKMYDETLWITAAYNDSVMTDGEPIIHYKTVTKIDAITGEEFEALEIDYVEYVVPSELVTMTDEQVEQMYDDAEYWDLSVCFEEYECKDKCETRTYTVQVPIEDDEEGEESGDSESDDDDDSGGGTRTETRTVKYCPGHIKGVVTLTFNWDTTKLIDKLQPGDSFEMFYDIIEEQYSKDKKGI